MTYYPESPMQAARRDEARNRAARMAMTARQAERVRNARIDAEADALYQEAARETAARDRRRRDAEELDAVQSTYELYGAEAVRAGFRVVRGRVVRVPPLRLTREQVQQIGEEAARQARPAPPTDLPPGWFERTARAMFAAKYGRAAPGQRVRDYPGSVALH